MTFDGFRFHNCRLRDGKFYAVLIDEDDGQLVILWDDYVAEKRRDLEDSK